MFWCFLLGYLVAKVYSDTGGPLEEREAPPLNLSNAYAILPSNDTGVEQPPILLLLGSQLGTNESNLTTSANESDVSSNETVVLLLANDTASTNEAVLLVTVTQPGANDSRANVDNSTHSGARQLQASQLTLQDARKRGSVGEENSLIPLKREKRTHKHKKGGCKICSIIPSITIKVVKKPSGGGCGQPQCGQPTYHPPPPPHPPPPQQYCDPCQRPKPQPVYHPPPPPPPPVYHPPPQPTCNPCQQKQQAPSYGGGGWSYSSSSSSSSAGSWGKK